MGKRLKRDVLLYYIYKMFCEPSLLGPILVLFFMGRNLSFFQVMLLQVVFSAVIVLLEVPTGALADRFGRKNNILLSITFHTISLIILIYANGFFMFLISEILVGISLCFKSGSDVSLIYDRLLEEGEEKRFTKVEGHATFLMAVVASIACLVSGFLFVVRDSLPVEISLVMILMGAIPIIFFKESKIEHKESISFKHYIGQIKNGYVYIKGHQRVKTIITYSVFLSFFFSLSFWFYPIHMKEIGLKVEYFGIVFAIMNVFYGLSSKYSQMIIKKTKGNTLIALSWIVSLGYIAGGLVRNIFGMTTFASEQVVRGLQPIVISKYLNKHIPTNKRATILSYNSLIQNLSSSVSKIIFGYLIDRFAVLDVKLGYGVIMLVGVFVMTGYLKKRM